MNVLPSFGWLPAKTSLAVLLLGSTGLAVFPVTPALAQAIPDAPEPQNGSASPALEPATEPANNAEIVVTASRRSQVLQDIPYNITALGGATLERAGATSLNNLGQVVPGLQNVDTGPSARGGNSNFSMRGLRTDSPGGSTQQLRSGSVASVSTYLGETPIFFPLALKDIDRVEVLKGPQGTLYGSGAQAGTIRLIPKRPVFDTLSGGLNVQGGLSQNSGKANYSADGVLNIPLASNLAVRIVGGYEHLGGFIDAVNLVQHEGAGDPFSAPVLRVPSDPRSGYALAPVKRDVNSSTQWFGRAALRWQISPAVEAELSYMHQHTHVDDTQISNPKYGGGTYTFDPAGLSANSINSYRPGGKYKTTADALSASTDDLNLANLLVSADVGFATITSSTSAYRTVSDQAAYYTPSTQLLNDCFW